MVVVVMAAAAAVEHDYSSASRTATTATTATTTPPPASGRWRRHHHTTTHRFYGVFDGVSQCPESRIYAQTLAKETSAALKRSGDAGGSWSDQAQAALQQAALAADRYSGSAPGRKPRPGTAGQRRPRCGLAGPGPGSGQREARHGLAAWPCSMAAALSGSPPERL